MDFFNLTPEMNISLLIISLSFSLQVLSAIFALQLITVHQKRVAGVVMLLATFLMAFRRAISLYRLIRGDEIKIDLTAEITACVISFLLLIGFIYISILISSLQREIYERGRAEKTLQDMNAKLQALMRSMPDVVTFKDVEGRHLWVNKAVETVTGLDKEELIGKTVEEVLPPEFAAMCRKSDEAGLRSSAGVHFEEHYLDKNGEKIFLDAIKSPIFDDKGNVAGLVSVSRDITRRKRAEEMIKLLSHRNEMILKSAGEGIFGIDLDGVITFANPIGAKMIGWNVEELIGKKQHEVLHHSHPDGAPYNPEDCPIYAALRDGASHQETNEIFWRRDGTNFPVEYVMTPIKENGKTTGAVVVFRDVTERKSTEEALRQSEERLRAIFENSVAGIAITDLERRVLLVNPAFNKMLGYEDEELIGKNIADISYPEDDRRNRDLYNEMLDGKRDHFQMEKRYIRRDGSMVWGKVAASFICDAKGRPEFAVAIIDDITERKRSDESLLLFNTLLNKSNDAIFVNEPVTGRFLFVNDRVCRNLGYDRQKLLTMRTIDIEAIFQDETAWKEHANEVKSKGHMLLEGVHKRRDGTSFPVEVGVTYMTLGDRDYMVAVARDITERKLIYDALRISEERLSKAQAIAHIGNWELNLATGRLYWSEEVYHIFGEDPAEYIPTSESVAKALNPDDVIMSTKLVHAALQEERPFETDCRLIRPDGTERTVHVIGQVMRDAAEKAILMSGTLQDITEQKKAEEALRRSHEQLEILVSERTAELRMINEQLRGFSHYLQEAREKERAFIAREIHDELGQALTALKMDLAWLRKKIRPGQKELMEKEAAMSELIKDTMQSVKRIATELRPGILDHLGLLAAIEWQTEEFQKRTGIECEAVLGRTDIIVDRDRSTAVFRIFQEALTNIARHAKATKVGITLNIESGEVMLQVKDNGRGITEKHITDPKSLGLTGIRERVHSWRGTVKISGSRNAGTEILVRIPLESQEALRD